MNSFSSSTSEPLLRREFLQRNVGLAVAGVSTSFLGACAYSPQSQGGRWPLKNADSFAANLVNASAAAFKERSAVMVELTLEAQKALLAGTGVGNGPSFIMPPVQLANGVIEVDLTARINGKGAPDVRGFVGIAFHIDDKAETFEAVYLRMTNGSKSNPPPPAPRNVFAVQYISYPDRFWRKLRQEHPNVYEKAAPVAIESWHKLRLEIAGSTVNAFVDGEKVLTVSDLRFPNRKGRIGLWVDDGTAGYFSDLKVKVAD
jgi:hypothetical protein